MQEFGALFIFLFLSFILGIVMLICSILAAPKAENAEKTSVYECGIDVKTGDGLLRLIKVKPEGKGEMFARDWANGIKL